MPHLQQWPAWERLVSSALVLPVPGKELVEGGGERVPNHSAEFGL